MNAVRGFTIMELMTTLAVLGVAVAVAIPSYKSLISNNRMASELNEFAASLYFARSEAIKRGRNVDVCVSTNDTTCAGAGQWEMGWIVKATGSSTVLKVYPSLHAGDTLRGTVNVVNKVTFNQNGFASTGATGTVSLCNSSADQTQARAIIIERTGRVHRAEDTGGDDIVEDHTDNNVTCP